MHSRRFVVVVLSILLVARTVPALAQTSSADRASTGTINGRVTDDSGAAVAGAMITVEHDDGVAVNEAVSRDDGEFSIVNVAAGPFRLIVSAPGFAPLSRSGVMAADETLSLSPIRLTLVAGTIGVDVAPARVNRVAGVGFNRFCNSRYTTIRDRDVADGIQANGRIDDTATSNNQIAFDRSQPKHVGRPWRHHWARHES